MTTRYEATVVENEDHEMILVLPEEVVETLKLDEGDCLDWSINDDGTIQIRKATF